MQLINLPANAGSFYMVYNILGKVNGNPFPSILSPPEPQLSWQAMLKSISTE